MTHERVSRQEGAASNRTSGRTESDAASAGRPAHEGLSVQTLMAAGGNQAMVALGAAPSPAASTRSEGADATRREGDKATRREDKDAAPTAPAPGPTTDASAAPAPELAPATPKVVTLTASATSLELGGATTLSAAVTGGAATAYKFQVRRATGTTWHDLGTGTAASYSGVARVAGQLRTKVVATVDATEVESAEAALAVSFPSFSTISANATVRGFCDAAWAATKAATTTTSRREEGFWIQLNSQSMTYQKTATVVGPSRANDEGASVSFGSRAPDNPLDPAPNASAVYTVASFHTHTPMTHRTGTRVTGPSGADQRIDTSDDVVGLVYDWTANPAVGGHPLTDAAQVYASGPSRRSTPP